MSFDGLLLVDKPIGWSSFDVVAKVRGILQKEYLLEHEEKQKIKVGHTGTLDPLATGLMIVIVGSYCKRASEFSKLNKTYEVQMKLGMTSTTGDEEGEKTKVQSLEFKVEEIEGVLEDFLGESMQTPPAFSAIKINGTRAYKLAREGKEVVIEPRKIKIAEIKLDKYDFPLVNFTVDVSSGTYVRSLVEDIGKKLDTGAYITSLRRTEIDKYSIKDAISVQNNEQKLSSKVFSLD